ncbi:MAG: FAD-dependent oxidoreductase [Phycisphaerae bacterium]|nr:FAD-dependent oxidoreductase [Phycisphaerae bacterium]NIW71425.1 FAD-dependent oxidoreductase [candidate division KSB1 bacterium]NIP54548.1 FAD-dependent oxidoreductase [Phycisphaerae bacterium]NIS53398.1 FAD-dependent oxidoreductase [Phycisphaerae bacterium]NIU10894.1 FAD-dependent oxidoreductase [Phycisphaerae bacterium]
MPKLTIDNHQVEVDDGATILDAADKLGIEIPTMCFLRGYKSSTSCMLCVVRVNDSDRLLPACGTIVQDGMKVESDSDQIREARKAALELLLSDHAGDCIGPCQAACSAHMNIPLMIRQIIAGNLRDAIVTVKKDIALPAVLGRICPKPCEQVCRRGQFDKAVSICLLKRYVADVDLQSKKPYLPTCKENRNKRVAVVGAGPTGLAAAYYLQIDGYNCTVFDDHEQPGGMLRYGVLNEKLPADILDAEIALIEKLGMKFQGKSRVGPDLSTKQLQKDFDAVLVAIGQTESDDVESMGLKTSSTYGIEINRRTYETNLPGVFAAGAAVRKSKLAVRAVADGREAALVIGQYLSGAQVTGPPYIFNNRIGKLQEGEIERFMADAGKTERLTPSPEGSGFTDDQASDEAARCMHCDCRKPVNCKLRQYAHQYGAKPTRYKGPRRSFVQQLQHKDVIYESGKCINCGLCIQVASQEGESLGLTFVGRGFDVRVAVPFDHSIEEGLKLAAKKCVKTCPTGALALRNNS